MNECRGCAFYLKTKCTNQLSPFDGKELAPSSDCESWKEMDGRRLVLVPISVTLFIEMVRTGWELVDKLVCREGVPQGAICIGSHTNNAEGTGYLCFEHYSLDPVPLGQQLPVKMPLFEKITLGASGE